MAIHQQVDVPGYTTISLPPSVEASDKPSFAMMALIRLTDMVISLFNIALSAGAMKIATFQQSLSRRYELSGTMHPRMSRARVIKLKGNHRTK